MTVGELRKALEKYGDDNIVVIVTRRENFWPVASLQSLRDRIVHISINDDDMSVLSDGID